MLRELQGHTLQHTHVDWQDGHQFDGVPGSTLPPGRILNVKHAVLIRYAPTHSQLDNKHSIDVYRHCYLPFKVCFLGEGSTQTIEQVERLQASTRDTRSRACSICRGAVVKAILGKVLAFSQGCAAGASGNGDLHAAAASKCAIRYGFVRDHLRIIEARACSECSRR